MAIVLYSKIPDFSLCWGAAGSVRKSWWHQEGLAPAAEVWKRGTSRMLLKKMPLEKTLPVTAEAGEALFLSCRYQKLHETSAVSFDSTIFEILLALEQAKRWPCLLGKDLQGT